MKSQVVALVVVVVVAVQGLLLVETWTPTCRPMRTCQVSGAIRI
jgi:hypothetical protein